MDVPSRAEFEELQSLVDSLCRYLGITATDCYSHSNFTDQVHKAIKNCDTIETTECPECGGSFREKNPKKFQKNDIT